MAKAIIVFPHQIFENNPIIKEVDHIYLVEHAIFFTAFTFHKQKLILHRASMKAYEDQLKKKKHKITYLNHKDAKTLYTQLKKDGVTELHLYEVTDHVLRKELVKECRKKKITIEWHETPQFLTSLDYIEKQYGKKQKFLMGTFYTTQRKRLNILIQNGKPVGGSWSFDKENREPLEENIAIPKITKPRMSQYVSSAINYIQKNWPKNPGNAKTFIYPVTHTQAKKWLDQFLKKRLKPFGTYQDAIIDTQAFLFHSLLSPLLNNGLLVPEFVVEKTLAYAKKHTVPINSLEGFIRQLIGWREYVRMVYHLIGEKERKSNFFSHRKKLSHDFWTASTGIEPVDKTIHSVLKYAYAHHIERLMILGNFMLISGIHPKDVYSWFMELFIDAYDWVMVPNVYGMSQYADGGMMSTKPYISSSAYLLKMSNYAKGEWCKKWDKLFWNFMKKHIGKLKKIPRMRFLINAYYKRKTRN